MTTSGWKKMFDHIMHWTMITTHLGTVFMAAGVSYYYWVFWQADQLGPKAEKNMLAFWIFAVFFTWIAKDSWLFAWATVKRWTRTLLSARSENI